MAYERFKAVILASIAAYKNLHVYLGRYNNRGLKTKWMAQFKVYGIVLQPTVALTTSVLARLFSGGAAPLGCYIAPLGFHRYYGEN